MLGTATNAPIPSANPSLLTFADGVEVLGQDYYPLGADFDGIGTLSKTGQMAASVQAVANQKGKQSAFALQAMDWQEYGPPQRCSPYPSCAPFPSLSQLTEQLNLVLQNSTSRLILWYSYFDILKSDNPTGNWTNLATTVRDAMTTPTTSPIPSRPVLTAVPAPVGYLDGASCSTPDVFGWTCDSYNYLQSLSVDLYRDGPAGSGGTYLTTVATTINRPDVSGVCGGTTTHGFTYIIPNALRDGKPHTIYAYGIHPLTGRESTNQNNTLLIGSPLSFTCPIITPTP